MSEKIKSGEKVDLSDANSRERKARLTLFHAKQDLIASELDFKVEREYLARVYESIVGSTVSMVGKPTLHTQILIDEGKKTGTTVAYAKDCEERHYESCELLDVGSSPVDARNVYVLVGHKDSWFDYVPIDQITDFEIVNLAETEQSAGNP